MDDTTYFVPLHYRLIVEELRPTINHLQAALLNRPVPGGDSLYDVTTTIRDTLGRLSLQTQKITHSMNKLGEVFAEDEPTMEIIRPAVHDLSKPCKALVDIYNDHWSNSYAEGYETGQVLLSAVLEKILRTIYKSLQQIAETVDNPAAVVERTGTVTINLQIVLEADRELELFNQWMKNTLQASSYDATQCKRSTLTPLLGAFGLGWLLGRDN